MLRRIYIKPQVVKLFSATVDKDIDTVINDFIKVQPHYIIEKISFDSKFGSPRGDRALVVFNVVDPPTHSVARGDYSVKGD